MNKRKHDSIALASFVILLFTLIGCNGSGDETISLEFGNPKKIVVGQWILSDMTRGSGYSGDFIFSDWKPGTRLVFYDDGTYSDSSDGGKTPHQWELSGNPDGSTPYYGGINLDDKEFGIGNLGPDHWILQYPKDAGDSGVPGWELGLDKEGDDPGPKTFEPVLPEPEPEPKPYPVVEKRYLVKEINEKSQTSNYQSSKTYYFTYDGKDRIEQFACVLNDYNRNAFSASYSYDNEEVKVENDVEGSFVGYFMSSSDLRISGFKCWQSSYVIDYTTNGYLISMRGSSGSIVNLQYANGNIAYLNNKPVAKLISEELNDANIDLNCFISGGAMIDYYFSHNPVFEPFGFYGKFSKNLLTNSYNNLDVTRDEHNNIVTIRLWDDAGKTRTLSITYEERSSFTPSAGQPVSGGNVDKSEYTVP